jgi:hypothetical protein
LPVTKAENAFEIEFEQDAGGALDKFHVHIHCFAAWSSSGEIGTRRSKG